MRALKEYYEKKDKTLVLYTNGAKTVVRCADIQRNVGVRGRKNGINASVNNKLIKTNKQ